MTHQDYPTPPNPFLMSEQIKELLERVQTLEGQIKAQEIPEKGYYDLPMRLFGWTSRATVDRYGNDMPRRKILGRYVYFRDELRAWDEAGRPTELERMKRRV